MRDHRGSLEERAFSILFHLPLRNRSRIFPSLFHKQESAPLLAVGDRVASRGNHQ
jgi:hypothetical protein